MFNVRVLRLRIMLLKKEMSMKFSLLFVGEIDIRIDFYVSTKPYFLLQNLSECLAFFCLNRIDFTYWMGICEGGKERNIKIIYSIRIESSIFDFSTDMFCVYDSELGLRDMALQRVLGSHKNFKNSVLIIKNFQNSYQT